MESEFARVSIMGPLPPFYAGLLASVRLEAGDAAQALDLLDTILKAVKEPGVAFYLPEIQRLRGECLLRLDPPNVDAAVRQFEEAIATATKQQARAFQLRAAMSLAGASTAADQTRNGTAPLQAAVDAFNDEEGDVVPQLAAARKILSAHPR